MNLNLNTHEVQLAPDVREYAEAKVRRLDRHFDRIVDAQLDFDVVNHRAAEPLKDVHLRVHLSGVILTAQARHKDARTAVDEVVDKLEEQLRRRKERLKERRAAPIARVVKGR
jgi:putative sigma-54 modulation protein